MAVVSLDSLMGSQSAPPLAAPDNAIGPAVPLVPGTDPLVTGYTNRPAQPPGAAPSGRFTTDAMRRLQSKLGQQSSALAPESSIVSLDDLMKASPQAATGPQATSGAQATTQQSASEPGIPQFSDPSGIGDAMAAGSLPAVKDMASGFARGVRDVIDWPAEKFAQLGDYLGITGGALPTRVATKAGDVAALQQFDTGAGQTWGGYAGRLGGQIAASAPLLATGEGLLGAGAGWLGSAFPAIADAGRAVAAIPGARYAGSILRNAAQGAGVAALTSGASDEPLAQQMGLGAGLGGVVGAVSPVLEAIGGGISRFAKPFTQGGREAIAGKKLADAASDLPAVQAALQNPQELVPGSAPTTFQATGDQGLGNLDRAVRTASPAPFLKREAEQNTARVEALNQLAPETANPDAVGAAFRDHLDTMDQQSGYQIAQAKAAAQDATNRIGGAVPAGADQQTTALQDYGQRLRAGLQAANDQARAQERGLWKAVDPDGNLSVNMTPIKQAAQDVVSSMPANAAPMTGDEAAIFGTAKMLPVSQPFAELGALRSRITDAMRQELATNGRSQTYGRLSTLLQSTHDAMEGSVAGQAANDAGAIAVGQMAPEQSVVARIKGWQNDWLAKRNAQAGGNGSGVGSGSYGRAGSTAVPGLLGAAGEGGGGPGGIAGNPGIPGGARAVGQPFDQAAVQRYQAARAATAQRNAIYTNAPGVGPVLAPGRFASDYRMPDEQVPSALFNSGPQAATRAQAFTQAAAGNPDTLQTMRDYAAFSLRRAAETPDGTIDPARYQKWLQANQPALQSFPGLADTFGNAANAGAALQDTTNRAALQRKAFEKSAAGQFLGQDVDAVQKVGRILKADNATSHMRDLAAATASNPAAKAGLQRSVVEHITNGLSDPQTGKLKPAAVQQLVARSHKALEQLFSPEQMQSIDAIAADLQRSSPLLTKLQGGSNTAQDLSAMGKHGEHPSAINTLILGEVAEHLGDVAGEHILGPLFGSFAGPISSVATMGLKTLREHGMEKVSDLLTEAMLNPAMARTLLAKVTEKTGPGLMRMIGTQFGAITQQAAMNELRRDQQHGGPGAALANAFTRRSSQQ